MPAGAAAIAYNITVVSPTGSGHLRVFPGDELVGGIHHQLGARDTVANGISVRIAADRTIRVFNGTHSPVRFLIDVAGYYGGSGALFHQSTRSGRTTPECRNPSRDAADQRPGTGRSHHRRG